MNMSKLALAASLVLGASGAFATTTFTETEKHQGDSVFTILNGDSRTVNTFEIVGDVTNPDGSFAAFCIELTARFDSPLTGLLGGFTDGQSAALSQLITGAGWKSYAWETDAIADTDTAAIAALQVGIWEIVYDWDANGFNLAGGSFRVGGVAQAAYGSTITDWMAGGNTGSAGSLRSISDGQAVPNLQDVMIAVPEPSTYALMIAGLGAIGFVARRRARRG